MELSDLFNKFISIYEKNQIPNWLSILGILVPIFLSIIVILQNFVINKRNEKLQKDISSSNEKLQQDIANRNEKLQKDIFNNEIKIKRYDVILNAYVSFIIASEELPTKEDTIKTLKLDDKNDRRNHFISELIKSRNKIILEEGKIKLLIKDDVDLINKLSELVSLYKYIENEITQSIIFGKSINERDVMEKIQKYKELLEYENYGKYFEKYLYFEEMN